MDVEKWTFGSFSVEHRIMIVKAGEKNDVQVQPQLTTIPDKQNSPTNTDTDKTDTKFEISTKT